MSQVEKPKVTPVPAAPLMPEIPPISPLEAKRIEERRLVRGKFIFHELPGGQMEFNYLCYKGDPLEKFHLKDGEVYEIPLGVARHLNTNCWYPIYGHNDKAAIAVPGSAVTYINEKIRRCSFQSLDFISAV